MSRLQQVLATIDKMNAEDPNREQVNGLERPKEQVYSERMSTQMQEYCPEASDELRIAAHAQHVRRWTSKRADYPEGKAGYYRWRTELGHMHAQLAANAMDEVGYSQESQDQVKKLLTKQGIKQNEDVQALEDVICLVFLQYYFLPFAAKHSEDKVISIVQKTWAKMSERGQQEALKLPLEETAQLLVKKALA